MNVLESFAAGDPYALARVISAIENRRQGYQDILAKLYVKSGTALRIGITGPPGAGKSTIVFRLAEMLAAQGKSLGVIAVDPTSPFTGGALLGDRIRMQELSADPNIFIRSMATRGSTGGLAKATRDVTIALDAFGKDIILIETVGVGQIELDIARACDTVIVAFVPESGDAVQAMKAGLMEIADIFCLNKADREGAERLLVELKSVLGLRKKKDEWEYPIIRTEAVNNVGIDDLWQAVEKHREFRREATSETEYQKQRIVDDLLTILQHKIDQRWRDLLDTSGLLENATQEILDGQTDPYTCANGLIQEVARRLADR